VRMADALGLPRTIGPNGSGNSNGLQPQPRSVSDLPEGLGLEAPLVADCDREHDGKLMK